MELWRPAPDLISRAQLSQYSTWLAHTRQLSFESYRDLWRWSTEHLEEFWETIWQYMGITSPTPYQTVLSTRKMPGATWFKGSRVNYTAHVFRDLESRRPHLAVIAENEVGQHRELTWAELRDEVSRLMALLRDVGVQPGDRVVGYLPNIPEALVALLATAGIGGVWACVSPDFGLEGTLARIRQLEPTILIAADGYWYKGRAYDRRDIVAQIVESLPSIRMVVWISYIDQQHDLRVARPTVRWSDLPTADDMDMRWVPFDHPLWILFSSGTTGKPKGLVHSHGGIMLTHWVGNALHLDLNHQSRFFWYTSTGWMMFNLLVSGLLAQSTVVLYDGHPMAPHEYVVWELADRLGITHLGLSAAYLDQCRQRHMNVEKRYRLSSLRLLGSTGSPLSPESAEWVYQAVKRDVWLASISGGTDVCSAFVGSIPWLPVYSGEIQGPWLGVAAEVWNEKGQPVVNQEGELVITEPLPSMPIFLWEDTDGKRYYESYFSTFAGRWRHGDWAKQTERGSFIIYGRSDATLNRGGIRLGTAEIYQVVEDLPFVEDSLAVEILGPSLSTLFALAVVPRGGDTLTPDQVNELRRQIGSRLTPHYVPDVVRIVPEIPRTLNGKKLEVPIKRILRGESVEQVMQSASVANPDSLLPFLRWADEIAHQP
ncbi:MAG: acetoacetate--CoA ligase [Firmicutes bacterium]|nr:acetoacetate--CoA ligase [Bacillota bacterium]